MNIQSTNRKKIVVAGASGDLGARIVSHLVRLGAEVHGLVRKGNNTRGPNQWPQGTTIHEVDYSDEEGLSRAVSGSQCVVSALSGVEEVIVTAQSTLLRAAVNAGVPRFIPSDYCIDYRNLEYGNNRNLDFRKRFQQVIDQTPIQATSVLNGMFTHLLTGQAPVILFNWKRVVYWENKEQLLDFTTIDNTAEYTAHAALDDAAPRFLCIAGDVINAKGLAEVAGNVTGKPFRLLKAGGLSRLQTLIKMTRTLAPQKNEVFPPWQGMQYLRDMFSGKAKLERLDNDRYGGMHWTTVKEVLLKAKS